MQHGTKDPDALRSYTVLNVLEKRYQRNNLNPYIEEVQTTQWPKEKAQKNKQRSTKHTHKAKDRVTGTALKTGGDPQVFRKGRQFLFH